MRPIEHRCAITAVEILDRSLRDGSASRLQERIRHHGYRKISRVVFELASSRDEHVTRPCLSTDASDLRHRSAPFRCQKRSLAS